MSTAQSSPPWQHLFAGAFAGTCAALITCPLDVLKTRLQSSEYSAIGKLNLPNLTRKVIQEEGVTALWKGAGAIVAGVGPARAIHFFAYAQAKQTLSSWDVQGIQKHILAATAAGILSVTSTSPVWVIKTRLQLQHNLPRTAVATSHVPPVMYRGFFHATAMIWKHEGLKGMFKGVSASYLGVTESVIQFVLYETFKSSFGESIDRLGSPLAHTAYFTLGALAKLSASCITYPHEVVRTRLRQVDANKYHGIVQTCRVILKEEGWRGMYGGMGTHLLRTVPNAAIMFAIVEAFTESGI